MTYSTQQRDERQHAQGEPSGSPRVLVDQRDALTARARLQSLPSAAICM